MPSLPSPGCSASLRRSVCGLIIKLSCVGSILFLAVAAASAQSSVVTYHNDVSRSGLNANEITLTPANVNSSQFGKLFSYTVDGPIYTQPLYVPNVAIPGNGTHNVVYVATENNSVYAFDADSNTGANANPLWSVSVMDAAHGAAPGATTVSGTAVGCTDSALVYGITGTPVIDPIAGTMYLDANSTENGVIVHRLHALDITTGAEKAPGPLLVTATVSGTGDGSSKGSVVFNTAMELQRSALLLLNGTLYVAFASHCDISPYHGWVIAYNAGTFAQEAVYNATPNGGLGGIWMGGGGLAADSNSSIYFATGNGTYDGSTGFGDTVMKMGQPSSGSFPILDWFTPYDQSNLDSNDTDQGSGGVLLLPDQPTVSTRQHLLVTGGKDGTIYLLDLTCPPSPHTL